jgi:acetylornithine deacetylase/succinyl-diaminopimelate desuccinylase-like protein
MDAFSPELTEVFAHIDTHRQSYLDRLVAYVRQPSVSAQGVGMAEAATLLLTEMERLGMHPRIIETGGWPMLLGSRCEVPGAPTVLLYGHYDVQPPEPLDAWLTPPFEPSIRGNRLYARGVADNKGQHFAQLLAIEALLATQAALPCNVLMLIEGEEELGSPHILDIVHRHRDDLQADLVVIADGPVHASERSWIVFGARGIVSFELHARGASTDLHSGAWGNIAPNPLWTLVHLLNTMKSPGGEITIDGIYDAVRPLSAAERATLSDLPVDPAAIKARVGLTRFDAPADRPLGERVVAWPSLTINGMTGGYSGPGAKTVLPSTARVKCDMRLVPDQTVAGVRELIAAHVQQHAPEVELVWLGGMEPSRTPLDSPFTPPLQQAFIDAEGQAPLLMPTLGGSLPNYVFTRDLGIPTFIVPYANADQNNHAPNENLLIDRFFLGIKTGAALLTRLGALPRSART